MTSFLWTLIAIQIVMGVFDTFYHHELTERLAWRPSQRYELQLHALRNMLYGFLFLVLGWLEVHGIFAMLVIAVLVAQWGVAMLPGVLGWHVALHHGRRIRSAPGAGHSGGALRF